MDQKAVVGAKPLIEPNSVESAPAVFVDGNAGITIGASVSKIHFHEVIGIDAATGGERRKVILNLHIPTTVLVEFCKNTGCLC